jgi:NAD-dependent dihydropyrimidine dehydrogenase PreA subunit
VKTKQILIEGRRIGIVGLDEVFEEFARSGRKPDKQLKHDLLDRFKQLNYIPTSKEGIYALAFLNEYEKFCELKEGEAGIEKKGLGTWQGIPREEIPWYPTIRDDLCDGCSLCLEFCPFGVYEYDDEAKNVKVVNPFNCVVGCSMCALKCKPKAIIFPPLTILEMFRKR